jgi:hypothetical protein
VNGGEGRRSKASGARWRGVVGSGGTKSTLEEKNYHKISSIIMWEGRKKP